MKIILIILVSSLLVLFGCESTRGATPEKNSTKMTDETKTEGKTVSATGAKMETKTEQNKPVQFFKLLKSQVTYPDGMVIQSRIIALDEKGSIKSEEIRGLQEVLLQKKIYVYSPDGIEITVNNAQNEFVSKSKQVITNGQLIKEVQYNSKNEELSSEEFSFEKGVKVSRILNSRTGGQNKTVYIYENGLLIKSSLQDGSGKSIFTTKKIYNSNNQLVTEEEYNSKDVLSSKTAYIYNAKGLVEKKEVQNEKGITQASYQYAYDENGNIIETKYFNRQGKLSEITLQQWKTFSN